MTPPADPERYTKPRVPGAIIRHGVWLSSRCTLSYRDVAALLCERGIPVSHEALRPWCQTLGQDYATRRRRPPPGDTWYLDAVCRTINGKRPSLWRAVDQDDNVLAILGQSRRHPQAAQKLVRKLLKGLPSVPRAVITETRHSDGAAKRARLLGVEHRQSRSRKNRGEHSHRPTRRRAYRRQGCQAPGHAPRLLSADGPIAPHVRPRRHVLSVLEYRQALRHRFGS